MDTAFFIGILSAASALAGVAASSAVALLKERQTNRYQLQRYRLDLLKQKYEEIYQELENLLLTEGQIVMQLAANAESDLEINMANVTARFDHAKLKMNIALYAPSLKELAVDVSKDRTALGECITLFVMDLKAQRSSKVAAVKAMHALLQQMRTKIERMQEEISALARSLMRLQDGTA